MIRPCKKLIACQTILDSRTLEVANTQKTIIVTGASQGIEAAVVQAFLDRNYNVVAASRSVSKAGFASSPNLALVDGDIGQVATAANIVQVAMGKFGSIISLIVQASSCTAPIAIFT
jgi:NAD(P)-dependent dehydrogenase (short-subunit alcohol dehydrogenase family)